MATDASIGYGAKFEVDDGTSPGAFVELAEITSITPPDESVDQIDATHMQSPGRRREFIQGLIDGGEMSLDMNWVPGSATDDFIEDWKASGETRQARITTNNNVTYTFPAFITGYSKTMPVDDKMTATLTVKVAGDVTIGTAT